MEDIMKIVKLLEESGLLVKGAKTIAKQKNKKDDFFQCHQEHLLLVYQEMR